MQKNHIVPVVRYSALGIIIMSIIIFYNIMFL
jgi:hypothetical protein